MRPELPRGPPDGVLRGEKPAQLVVGRLDGEPAEHLADHARVLELVERVRTDQERQVGLAEPGRRAGRLGQVVAAHRVESGRPAGLEELVLVREVEERVAPVEEHGLEHPQRVGCRGPWCRTCRAARARPDHDRDRPHDDVDDLVIFVLAALALIPLAWLIGEATEHAAHHTGPGIGGFLNATFGNAPELIIALIAVNEGLTEVVRGSLTGSVVGNLLLVLGFSLAFGGRGQLDRESSFTSFALVGVAIVLLLIPSIPGWEGDPTAIRSPYSRCRSRSSCWSSTSSSRS